MSLTALASLILALCKAVPAAAQLAELVGAQLAEGRRHAADALTQADLARVAAQPWVCPRTCPHQRLHRTEQPAPAAGPAGL